jgi:hypothetical protein
LEILKNIITYGFQVSDATGLLWLCAYFLKNITQFVGIMPHFFSVMHQLFIVIYQFFSVMRYFFIRPQSDLEVLFYKFEATPKE